MNKNYLWFGLFVSIVCIAVPIGFYICAFWKNGINYDHAQWGQFGDYMGGTLNPIIAFLTLLVTVYIAYELAQLDDKRNNAVIEFEKKRFLTELRESEYRRISQELQKVPMLFVQSNRVQQIGVIIINFDFFLRHSDYLFSGLNEEEVSSTLQERLSNLLIFYDREDADIRSSEVEEAFREYSDALFLFTNRLQFLVVDQLE